MGKDYPDWGGQYNSKELYPVFDMGELAARLGSIVTFDRRGAVLWLDNFAYGLQGYDTGAVGAGAVVELSTDYIGSHPFSVKLQSGGADGNTSYINRVFPVPLDPTVGLSVALSLGVDDGLVQIDVLYYTGSVVYTGRLEIAGSVGELRVLTSSGTVVIDSALPNFAKLGVFNPVKLVLDLDTGTLLRAIFLRTEYDLSTYTLQQSVSSTQPHLELRVRGITDGVGNIILAYLDNYIYTVAEPL